MCVVMELFGHYSLNGTIDISRQHCLGCPHKVNPIFTCFTCHRALFRERLKYLGILDTLIAMIGSYWHWQWVLIKGNDKMSKSSRTNTETKTKWQRQRQKHKEKDKVMKLTRQLLRFPCLAKIITIKPVRVIWWKINQLVMTMMMVMMVMMMAMMMRMTMMKIVIISLIRSSGKDLKPSRGHLMLITQPRLVILIIPTMIITIMIIPIMIITIMIITMIVIVIISMMRSKDNQFLKIIKGHLMLIIEYVLWLWSSRW